MNNKNDMGFAEWLGRIILFPLSWIDNAIQDSRRQNVERRDTELAEQMRLASERGEEENQRRREEAEAIRSEQLRQQARIEALIEEAKYECQVLYDRNEFQIRDKFPPEKLQSYFGTFLKPNIPEESLRKRITDLKETILSFVEGGSGSNVESAEEIAAFYEKQREKLMALGLSSEELENQLADLNYRQDQAIQEYLRKL